MLPAALPCSYGAALRVAVQAQRYFQVCALVWLLLL